jgi:hypothetical protein
MEVPYNIAIPRWGLPSRVKALEYSDPSSGKRLSKVNEPIGKRLGDSGRDKGEGGLESSEDIDIHGLWSWEKGNKRRIVGVRQMTRERVKGESTWSAESNVA